ncbi:hypothetical protein HWV62_40844 [Athelia sp. TMB]|nr:hypothetical protein HWV62_40844 [Athelia sp. TMB]
MQLSMTSLFSLFFALLSALSLVSAAPLSLDTRDVYAPPVTYPHSGTVWKVGDKYTVTWDASNPPKQITNKIGEIYLRRGDTTILDKPLAKGFSILKGHQEITVPEDVKAGSDYRVVLFGDSGNWSEKFTIKA